MKILVSMADDHPMVITGIKKMLRNNKEIQVMNIYPDGLSLLENLKPPLPDVLLMDIQMPGKSGEELTPLLLKQYPDLKILMLTTFDSTLHVHNMFRLGAKGYLLKSTDKATLISAIETVHNGGEFLQKEMREKMESMGLRARREVSTKSNLTAREKEVLQCIVDGLSSKEIAEKLFLGIRTVDNYRLNILLKMDAKNIAVLVRKALEIGLVK